MGTVSIVSSASQDLNPDSALFMAKPPMSISDFWNEAIIDSLSFDGHDGPPLVVAKINFKKANCVQLRP